MDTNICTLATLSPKSVFNALQPMFAMNAWPFASICHGLLNAESLDALDINIHLGEWVEPVMLIPCKMAKMKVF